MGLENRFQAIDSECVFLNSKKMDQFFTALVFLQWLASIALTYFQGQASEHLFTTILAGGALCLIPSALILFQAGNKTNSYAITVAQALFTYLFVYVSAPGMLAQCCIFGSLVLLSCYSIFNANRILKLLATSQVELNKSIEQNHVLQKEVIEYQQKMLSTAKMSSLGEMAGGIGHEINNPVGVISGMAGIMDELLKQDKLSKEKHQYYITKIISTAERISKILHGLKMFSRDGSNDEVHKMDIRSIISETISFCSDRFYHSEIKIECISGEDTLYALGQEAQISQVILNLLNNAHDAVQKTKDPWVRISASEKDGLIEIRITDSGNGISPEIQKKLFQSFFTTKEIGKGTGLGLSISHKIIINHQGDLFVDQKDPNTCFVIQLPIYLQD